MARNGPASGWSECEPWRRDDHTPWGRARTRGRQVRSPGGDRRPGAGRDRDPRAAALQRRQLEPLPPPVRDRRPAGQGQPGPDRRRPGRERRRRQADRQRAGAGRHLREPAAARGHHGDRPRDVALGNRQPLHLDRARTGQQSRAREQRDHLRERYDHPGRHRSALQHPPRPGAPGAQERHPGLGHGVRRQGPAGQSDLQVPEPVAGRDRSPAPGARTGTRAPSPTSSSTARTSSRQSQSAAPISPR